MLEIFKIFPKNFRRILRQDHSFSPKERKEIVDGFKDRFGYRGTNMYGREFKNYLEDKHRDIHDRMDKDKVRKIKDLFSLK